jgi:hypothetical protein
VNARRSLLITLATAAAALLSAWIAFMTAARFEL